MNTSYNAPHTGQAAPQAARIPTRPENIGMRFVLALPDGRQHQLVVDARHALVGAGAHCEVRLDQEFAAPEHVEAVIDHGVIHLRALSSEPMPLMNNVPFSQGQWPKGGVLSIGPVRIAAEVVDLSDNKKRTNPLYLLFLMPFFAIIGLVVYLRTSQTAPYVFPAAPPLFDEPITRCPTAGQPQDSIVVYAQEKRRVALAERERSPFAPRDGLDAVPNFELAAACFRAANSSEDADANANAALALRRKEEEEYHVRRVRLEHAYLENDVDAMDRETRILGPMVAHRTGPYVEWLGEVIRRVKLIKGAPSKGLLG